ncbi:MAG: urea ABC transporter ATP-binding protein UrtD [Halioglobus sp.]|nr:urea ABC transporter ATP-binding protein UrtD [Halioglobus sp.]|tara:strand:+ start:3413 stop:4249 length:837 start_codon:yes stop_codon:yes gene_type:complete
MSIGDTLRSLADRETVFPLFFERQPPVVDTSKSILLYIEDLTVSFDGFRALNDLNLYIEEGELRCLIGANGAGKTTLMDVITGKTQPDAGEVWFGQTLDLLGRNEAEIAGLGIGRKFQKPSVFEAQTVYANLELAMRMNKGILPTLLARLDSEQLDRIDHVLGVIGLQAEYSMTAGALSHGQKQWLEIGMLLMSEPRLLLIDEPVAGMTAQETERTAELLTSLAGERTVVVVEHDMAFVRSIARTVSVLHQGSLLAEGSMSEVQNDPAVIEVYLGEGH